MLPKSKYLDQNKRLWKILDALEDNNFEDVTDDDLKLAGKIISSDLRDSDFEALEELIKEQLILELSGVEKIFKE